MADLFARENELLGGQFSSNGANGFGDDIDFERAASAFPDIDVDGEIPLPPSNPAGQQSTSSGFGFDFDEPAHPDVKVTGDDEIEKFESEFPDIGGQESFSPVPSQPSFHSTSFAPQPTQPTYSAPSFVQPIEEEPEVIKQWREKQADAIRARDEASAQKRRETIAKAERSIDEFYEEYNAKKERNIKENKESEQAYLDSLRDSLGAGTTWSRIADLIELQNSQSKTLARIGPNTTDLSRFKEVLLRLRREGDAAPGAAGY